MKYKDKGPVGEWLSIGLQIGSYYLYFKYLTKFNLENRRRRINDLAAFWKTFGMVKMDEIVDENQHKENGDDWASRILRPKNPDAVALGRRGGSKGGIARKLALTPEQRTEIASKAARARWGNPIQEDPYKAVLQDLRAQRKQIDQVIKVIMRLRSRSSTG